MISIKAGLNRIWETWKKETKLYLTKKSSNWGAVQHINIIRINESRSKSNYINMKDLIIFNKKHWLEKWGAICWSLSWHFGRDVHILSHYSLLFLQNVRRLRNILQKWLVICVMRLIMTNDGFVSIYSYALLTDSWRTVIMWF